ncbi:hypothetical protein SPI_01409 [Niveomyces insectorum RCEF 264]|uniref:Uncharacterized protein n=1 Tax=Niveomyces insectorum RCEF 264 TaxID=1081102 RepID=A0A167YXZ9_9HYPO|nr:hypothetical protein SPI_01409 [Niveomyces insectorum RCEF 264]
MASERSGRPWHAAFEQLVLNVAPHNERHAPYNDYVYRTIESLVREWEKHEANEIVWAHPERGLVARVLQSTYAPLDEYLLHVGNMMTYFDGHVAAGAAAKVFTSPWMWRRYTEMPEGLTRDAFAGVTLRYEPFHAFSTTEWMNKYAAAELTPWPALDSLFQTDAQRRGSEADLVDEDRLFTPLEFVKHPRWYRLRHVRARFFQHGFVRKMEQLDEQKRLKTVPHGTAVRLMWYLIATLLGANETMEVTEARVKAIMHDEDWDAVWVHAFTRIRGRVLTISDADAWYARAILAGRTRHVFVQLLVGIERVKGTLAARMKESTQRQINYKTNVKGHAADHFDGLAD